MFSATLEGDWSKAKEVMRQLPTFVTVLQATLVDGVSQEYYNRLKDHFESQDLNLEPLSQWYSQWKAKRGLDSRILIATGQMLREIGIHDDGSGKFVGIKGGKRHRSGIDIALLALLHEYGSTARGVPARPVYRVTVQELKRELRAVVQSIIDRTSVQVFG